MSKKDNKHVKVMVVAPKDGEFSELYTLSYKEMYNLVGKFIKKAIPIKGTELTIIQGRGNRVSTPKVPYILMNIVDENRLSSNESYYRGRHKIFRSRS